VSHVILMNHLLRDVFERAHFRVQQDVRLSIKGFALGKKRTDFGEWIRMAEQGTMSLAAHPFPNFFRRCPEANDERMAFEAGEIVRIRGQSAAAGNNGFLSGGEFDDDFSFELAKKRFAFLRKNLADGFAGARFDDVIGVEESEVQLAGDQLADGGLAGSHETDERNVLNLARGAHRIELADLARDGTLKS
jgi:hypothetical protein